MNTYKVIRFFSDGRFKKTTLKNVTLEIAQLHCKSDLTHGTLRNGITWFDGYTQRRAK